MVKADTLVYVAVAADKKIAVYGMDAREGSLTHRADTVVAAGEPGALAVDPGYVCGIIQDGVGYRKNEPVIRLHMEAYLGAPESYDSVEIDGSPSISSKIAGGIHGDVATASIVVNSIPKVLQAAPGLHTMRDLALPSFFPGR